MTETEVSGIESEKKHTQNDVHLNDWKLRLIGIPFFGILIPNVAGLFGNLSLTSFTYWMGYLYFVLLAYLIWQGNRYLLFRTRQRFTWFDKPMEKLVLLLINNIFYTAPLTVAWLCTWYLLAGFAKTDWNAVEMVVLINVICVLFVTHVYETVFLVKEKESETVKNEQLQRAKAEAELVALKNQVDPHFMFNSLNTLSYLVKSDSDKALIFTENLADIYRYILMQKDYALILLEDELAFTERYLSLLHLRFGNALIVRKGYSDLDTKKFLVPPTSVFVAFENAVKHNEISEKKPLLIVIDIRENRLIISNTIQKKGNIQDSTKIGLKNLDERFMLVTDSHIETTQTSDKFIVNLPLSPLATHESHTN
ncbi:sensor histidine kinase [Reichenbachiella faecimaris]|nr:sensor histidine kinase [Reichenbachiella faecimaris]